jgi:predicted glycosyltransferase
LFFPIGVRSNEEFTNTDLRDMFRGARIAVAPLDWGLGHAARDIPIIRRLIELDARPVLLADKGPLALLREAFPELPFAVLPGVEVRYGRGGSQVWAMMRQFPALLRSIHEERSRFLELHREWRFDAVISDNRFGVRADGSPSVVITHQVNPITPVAQGVLRRSNRRLLARFDRCWIMDEPQAPGWAGELSHSAHLPPNTRYIGTLSRFKPQANTGGQERRIVAVISGPEPQRTRLEGKLVAAMARIPGRHLLVRGLPMHTGAGEHGTISLLPHLGSDALADAMQGAELIVSRSGYTTLMDLLALGRPALLVPTPGQPEQEYLGKLHAGSGRFLVQPQDSLDLEAALHWVRHVSAPTPIEGTAMLDAALEDLARLL